MNGVKIGGQDTFQFLNLILGIRLGSGKFSMDNNISTAVAMEISILTLITGLYWVCMEFYCETVLIFQFILSLIGPALLIYVGLSRVWVESITRSK